MTYSINDVKTMGNQMEIKINAYAAFDTSRPVFDLQKENPLKSRHTQTLPPQGGIII